jgi:hypothetical protein
MYIDLLLNCCVQYAGNLHPTQLSAADTHSQSYKHNLETFHKRWSLPLIRMFNCSFSVTAAHALRQHSIVDLGGRVGQANYKVSFTWSGTMVGSNVTGKTANVIMKAALSHPLLITLPRGGHSASHCRRQTDRRTDGQTDRQRGRQTYRHTTA